VRAGDFKIGYCPSIGIVYRELGWHPDGLCATLPSHSVGQASGVHVADSTPIIG
jgi:hypothetical protein